MTTFVSSGYTFGQLNSNMTDASFRTRIQHYHDCLVGAGLIQTADTGQINFSTVTVPAATNTDAGYAIYRFDDSRQGVDPVFLKILYGKGSQHYAARMRVQAGQGTNGAGTLTGNTSATILVSGAYGATSASPTFQSYACHTDGFLALCIGPGNLGTTYPLAFFCISRTRDVATYAFDGTGLVLLSDNGSAVGCGLITFSRWIDNPFNGGLNRHYCIAPGLPADTALANGDKQLYPHFYADPQVRQLWSHFTVRGSEIGPSMTTFSATPVAAGGPRTFIHYGENKSLRAEATDPQATWNLCHLWE